jgi:hypothetical protein
MNQNSQPDIEICGSHGGDGVDCGFQGSDAVYSSKLFPVFWIKESPQTNP